MGSHPPAVLQWRLLSNVLAQDYIHHIGERWGFPSCSSTVSSVSCPLHNIPTTLSCHVTAYCLSESWEIMTALEGGGPSAEVLFWSRTQFCAVYKNEEKPVDWLLHSSLQHTHTHSQKHTHKSTPLYLYIIGHNNPQLHLCIQASVYVCKVIYYYNIYNISSWTSI